MARIPLSVLAGVVQSHLDIAKLIPDRALQKGNYLRLIFEGLSPDQQQDVARALLRLRICGQYLAQELFEVEGDTTPQCPGCKSRMIPLRNGGYGCFYLTTPSCIRSTKHGE